MFQALTIVRQCPYCGSRDVVVDHQRGIVVCRSCGAVLDDTIVSFSPHMNHSSLGKVVRVYRAGSIAEENTIIARFNSLRLHVKMSSKLRTELINQDTVKLIDNASGIILRNKCLSELWEKLADNEKLAVMEIAGLLAAGEEPLPSIIAAEFNIQKRRVKLILNLVRRCLDLERPVDMLGAKEATVS